MDRVNDARCNAGPWTKLKSSFNCDLGSTRLKDLGFFWENVSNDNNNVEWKTDLMREEIYDDCMRFVMNSLEVSHLQYKFNRRLTISELATEIVKRKDHTKEILMRDLSHIPHYHKILNESNNKMHITKFKVTQDKTKSLAEVVISIVKAAVENYMLSFSFLCLFLAGFSCNWWQSVQLYHWIQEYPHMAYAYYPESGTLTPKVNNFKAYIAFVYSEQYFFSDKKVLTKISPKTFAVNTIHDIWTATDDKKVHHNMPNINKTLTNTFTLNKIVEDYTNPDFRNHDCSSDVLGFFDGLPSDTIGDCFVYQQVNSGVYTSAVKKLHYIIRKDDIGNYLFGEELITGVKCVVNWWFGSPLWKWYKMSQDDTKHTIALIEQKTNETMQTWLHINPLHSIMWQMEDTKYAYAIASIQIDNPSFEASVIVRALFGILCDYHLWISGANNKLLALVGSDFVILREYMLQFSYRSVIHGNRIMRTRICTENIPWCVGVLHILGIGYHWIFFVKPILEVCNMVWFFMGLLYFSMTYVYTTCTTQYITFDYTSKAFEFLEYSLILFYRPAVLMATWRMRQFLLTTFLKLVSQMLPKMIKEVGVYLNNRKRVTVTDLHQNFRSRTIKKPKRTCQEIIRKVIHLYIMSSVVFERIEALNCFFVLFNKHIWVCAGLVTFLATYTYFQCVEDTKYRKLLRIALCYFFFPCISLLPFPDVLKKWCVWFSYMSFEYGFVSSYGWLSLCVKAFCFKCFV